MYELEVTAYLIKNFSLESQTKIITLWSFDLLYEDIL